MSRTQKTQHSHGFTRGFLRFMLFASCGTAAFALGLQSVNELTPVEHTIAQATQRTQVNVILQYNPVGGGDPIPIEITPFMNSSQTALLQLQEIHSGIVFPSNPADRCLQTSSVGRCNIRRVPVGPDPGFGVFVDQQYDVLVDTVFIEFLTGIPLVHEDASVLFDPSECGSSNTSFTGNTWCLTKPGGNFASEYFITITLNERDVCSSIAPPANFCRAGDIVEFVCDPQTKQPTNPWASNQHPCDAVQCPDGNTVAGVCSDIVQGFAACSTAAACSNNQLCSVQNFGTNVSYAAGNDTMVIRGERFGNAGGTVSFQTSTGREVVEVFPGPNWTDTEIRVRVPLNAVSGELLIHPNTHGFIQNGQELIPVTCSSPPASILAFIDQFSLLSVNARVPNGVQLLSPGYDTHFTVIAQHNDSVSRFDQIHVELIDGAFTDPNDLPLSRTLITQKSCPVEIVGSPLAKEATLECAVFVPESAEVFTGPFTYIITLFDDAGESARATMVATKESALIGDFSFDRRLTIEDAVIARRLAEGSATVLDADLERDTNADGAITREDVLFILHALTQ